MEIKIVYSGYGLSGKTTNINHIYEKTEEKNRVELNYREPHILRCKVIRKIESLNEDVLLHLVAKVGNIYSPKTEFEILENVDGIIFVAHSHKDLMHLNIWQLESLQSYLTDHGYKIYNIPYVLQCNKRDLTDKLSIDDMIKELRIKDEPVFEAITYKGIGVFETLNCLLNQIIEFKYKRIR